MGDEHLSGVDPHAISSGILARFTDALQAMSMFAPLPGQRPDLGKRVGGFAGGTLSGTNHARSTNKQVFIAWLNGTACLSVMASARDKTQGRIQEGFVPHFDTSIPSEAHRKRAPQRESKLEHPNFGAVIRAWA